MKKTKILIIEDNADFAFSITMLLSTAGYATHLESTLSGGRQALAMGFDLVLLDLSLPDGVGCEGVSLLKNTDPTCPIIVLTGQDSAKLAVSTLREGASDYLTKPVERLEFLRAIRGALERAQLNNHIREMRQHREQTAPIGESPAWKMSLELIYAASRAPRTTVLLRGESGVGKEVAALLLHKSSRCGDGPYVAVNASCFPASMLESELYGHESGAFTGATRQKKGLLELANGGTLFLDEIGDLALDLQSKLLRILEGHPYRRIGGEQEITPNARIVCATNRPLEEAVRAGQFRADLFHRLKIFEIVLPPLRERAQDIEKLALHFVAKLGAEMGRNRATISPEMLSYLAAYSWPGNVRELRNVIERALVLSQDQEILPKHLPKEITAQQSPPWTASSAAQTNQCNSLERVIQQHITEIYKNSMQNLTRTASLLGISRLALRKRLRAYGLKQTSST
jgi:DNA-binding NtrC family response regulator